jgi:hypothetical protein
MIAEPPDPKTRPTRLSCPGQVIVAVLLGASFVSGVMVWYGKRIQADELSSPAWLQPAITVHGCLNPVLCILFGYLVCQHIRVGWQMRANLVTGFLMEAVFALMILSGAGLYYVGDPEWRDRIVFLHQILGVALPLALALHWIAGLCWGRKMSEKS